jgi:tRNA uridine 5-carboxymethylaminomethyl modification enzyme
MKQPGFSTALIPEELRGAFDCEIWELLETELKYEGYLRRQESQMRSLEAADAVNIPNEVDYSELPGLRNEARQKLSRVRPDNLGQAGRISGVTPSDLGVLAIWLRKRSATLSSQAG